MKLSVGDYKDFGAVCCGKDVIFTFSILPTTKKVSLDLYKVKDKKLIKSVKLTEEFAVGLVYSVKISDLDIENTCYLINQDGKGQTDPYSRVIVGRDSFNDEARKEYDYKVFSGIANLNKSWSDSPVSIDPKDMIIYKLHVRGFTGGLSMKGARFGNYKGILSKIPYFKELGITSLELMPLYDFEELTLESKQIISKDGDRSEVVESVGKTNYWGYGEASYFAPKASYFGGALKACDGFRDFVSTLHKNGIELIMEMSFSEKTSPEMMIDSLKFYVQNYHVDGFHIIGCNAPIERIVKNPFLADTKIFYEYIPEELLCTEAGKKHLFIYNDSFMWVTRQIQNHMNGSMVQFANHMRRQNQQYGFVNYMANVTGFSLYDSFAYGEKHNQDNGEDNRDGINFNYSFNNGAEGATKVKAINNKRFLDMRNAFASIMLSQSVPLLVAGDEVAATHEGNNNPYCQDNKIGYTVFTKTKNKQLLQKFVKELIEFRKKHQCIRPENAFSMNDYKHLGLPDMSFHGSEPWMMAIGDEQKSLGVLFNGAYADESEEVYVCYNYHYDDVEMALPLLAPKKRWRQVFNTLEYNETSDFNPKPINNQQSIIVPGSSITVLIGLKP